MYYNTDNLENVLLTVPASHEWTNTAWFCLCEVPEAVSLTETGSSVVVAGAWEPGGRDSCSAGKWKF